MKTPSHGQTAEQKPAGLETMSAIVQHHYGTSPEEVLRVGVIARPTIRDDEVLVHVRAASVATAMQAINAVPALCAAPAGIRTMADLPLVRAGHGFGNVPPVPAY